MQILDEAGGWQAVLNRFKTDHLPEMDRYASRFMVLLIDRWGILAQPYLLLFATISGAQVRRC